MKPQIPLALVLLPPALALVDCGALQAAHELKLIPRYRTVCPPLPRRHALVESTTIATISGTRDLGKTYADGEARECVRKVASALTRLLGLAASTLETFNADDYDGNDESSSSIDPRVAALLSVPSYPALRQLTLRDLQLAGACQLLSGPSHTSASIDGGIEVPRDDRPIPRVTSYAPSAPSTGRPQTYAPPLDPRPCIIISPQRS
ncbi:hypothetical protein MKEN_00558600 [Mycena kentingensis (nom. inval.)]|nr:hypothetical protein MKEN_00558600 [Mycena kentingensis (nom. inval.)]